ncbi:RHS repeat-associated core domain-containing protein, partial [Ectobacillus antri]
FGYAGYMYDKEIGMYYLMARYYHLVHGVFISVDPDPGDADDPITQNGYTYVNNNPVMFIDPDGKYLRIIDYIYSIPRRVDRTLVGWSRPGHVGRTIASKAFSGAAYGGVTAAIYFGHMQLPTAPKGLRIPQQEVRIGVTGGIVLGAHFGAVRGATSGYLQYKTGKTYVRYRQPIKKKYSEFKTYLRKRFRR